ncbi:hypothetical protein [Pseudokineococcus sp. 1T1Z-3]|uniref:hypothetical protein n=1 Tax=Pseudokineococcus sp. 1T1Z-3 TaxID=3132745 RepID=UPI00309C81A1
MLLRTRPGLRRAWRDVGRVQLGEDTAHAVVLDGLAAGEEAVLDDLVEGVEATELLARCGERGARGLSPAALEHLLGLLRDAGALEPTPVAGGAGTLGSVAEADSLGLLHGGSGWDLLARRSRACVRVEGLPRTATALAAGLLEAGVGRVDLRLDGAPQVRPEDVTSGGLRQEDVGWSLPAAAERLRARWEEQLGRAPGSTLPGADGTTAPDLVVLAARGALPPERGTELVRQDRPHLAVVLGVRSAVVGPFVLPGRTPCLRCVELHRGDRDPEWPRVATQLAYPSTCGGEDSWPREDVVLVRLVSALAVAQALAHLDATSSPAGPSSSDPGLVTDGRATSWEVDLADGLTRGRRVELHPDCGCAWFR